MFVESLPYFCVVAGRYTALLFLLLHFCSFPFFACLL